MQGRSGLARSRPWTWRWTRQNSAAVSTGKQQNWAASGGSIHTLHAHSAALCNEKAGAPPMLGPVIMLNQELPCSGATLQDPGQGSKQGPRQGQSRGQRKGLALLARPPAQLRSAAWFAQLRSTAWLDQLRSAAWFAQLRSAGWRARRTSVPYVPTLLAFFITQSLGMKSTPSCTSRHGCRLPRSTISPAAGGQRRADGVPERHTTMLLSHNPPT